MSRQAIEGARPKLTATEAVFPREKIDHAVYVGRNNFTATNHARWGQSGPKHQSSPNMLTTYISEMHINYTKLFADATMAMGLETKRWGAANLSVRENANYANYAILGEMHFCIISHAVEHFMT